MAFPNNDPRKLSYNLRGVETLNEITPDETIDNLLPDFFPVDPDEKITIGLNVSLNEYVALATSIDVGRDIAFGDDSIKLWFLWLRALREHAMINCDDVANCIETSVSVQTAITNEYQSTVNEFLLSNGVINPNTIDPQTTTYPDRLPEHATGEIKPPPSPDPCDLDKLWAGIREAVERCDQQGRDLLEDLSLSNDRIEQIFEVIDLVPILGDIIKDVSDFFTALIPDLLNGYNAYSSPAALDNVACVLFNLVCADCRYPTYDEWLEYFTSNSVAGLATSPQLLNYTQVWTAVKNVPAAGGALVWHTIVSWLLLTLYFGGRWNGSWGKNTLRIWSSFGEDLPNDNWIILCGDCVPWIPLAVPSTSNPFGSNGFGITTINVSANESVQYEYIDNVWAYGTAWSGNYTGNTLEPAPTGSVMVGNPLGQLLVGNGISWQIANASGVYDPTPYTQVFFVCNDKNGVYGDNTGELNLRYKIMP